MPGVFVVLWSTGFIGAKFGLPYAEPLTFLALRFGIVAGLLAGLAIFVGAPWPPPRAAVHIAIAGLLIHGVYLGGVFASIYHGVEAGVSALIVSIQPLLVAALAGAVLGEGVARWQWIGLVLGLSGVALVVGHKLGSGFGTPVGVVLSVLALLGMSAGTLYQKKYCAQMDLRSGNCIQFAASTLAMLAFAWPLETMAIVWAPQFLFALAWLCLIMSIGAISLLVLLIRRGAASRVSSLLFLVPPCTALMGWLFFDETLSGWSLLGMAAAMTGVALVNLRR
ncbi:MAG: DMT family transporter [Alphaproteobacteria bacterium]|nr:DMT family transporter [Alphaproteobacteria bacterium]